MGPGFERMLLTNVNVPLEDDQSSLFAYVVWIFLAFLTYPVVPPYLLSTRNEDTIFDPGISMYHSFMPDVSHRSGTFIINVYPNRLNESPMMILISRIVKTLVLAVLLHSSRLRRSSRLSGQRTSRAVMAENAKMILRPSNTLNVLCTPFFPSPAWFPMRSF
ncbi:hypothetical protein Tco_0045318 [Tanacetum coccineum]